MNRRIRSTTLLAILMLIVASPLIASADPGTPTASGVCIDGGSSTNAQLRINFDQVANDGAAGFSVVIHAPDANVQIPTGSCANAGAFATLSGCAFFSCSVVNRGAQFWSVEGTCLAGAPSVPSNLQGSVQGPTIGVTNSGPDGRYVMDLVPNVGATVSQIFDGNFPPQAYNFQDTDLTDGFVAFNDLCAPPTAVNLTSLAANPASPAALSLWPLLAGGGALAAGAAVALSRRKR